MNLHDVANTILTLSGGMLVLALVPACEPNAELTFVEEKLAGISGIGVVRVWGNDGLFDTGRVNAEILLRDGTPAMLFGMGRVSFEGVSRVSIAQIGTYSPWVQSYACSQGTRNEQDEPLKKIFTSGALDVGRTSFAAHQLLGEFENVLDALSRQDELRGTIRALPRCPNHNDVKTADGSEYRYCVQDCPSRSSSCTSGPGNAPDWIDSEPCG
jgi:hypothetical protein